MNFEMAIRLRDLRRFESFVIAKPVCPDTYFPSCQANDSAEKSRQLGFLRFQSVSDARAFLEPNFPSVFLYGPNPVNGHRTRVRIAYSREREDRVRSRADGDWVCNAVSFYPGRTVNAG